MAKKVVAVPVVGKKTVANNKEMAKKVAVSAHRSSAPEDDNDTDDADDDDDDDDDIEEDSDEEEMEVDDEGDDDEGDDDEEDIEDEHVTSSSNSNHEDVIDDLNYDVRNLATFNYHPIRLQGNSAVDEATILEAATRATQLLVKRYVYYLVNTH